MRRTITLLAVAVALAAPLSHAAVFIVPSDGELVDTADAIVLGTVVSRHGEFAPNGDIVTVTEFAITRVFKGQVDPAAPLRVTDPGGVVGTAAMFVSDGVTYVEGERVLLFLEKTADGWTTWGLCLGAFHEVTDGGVAYFARGMHKSTIFGYTSDMRRHDEHPRRATAFLRFVARRAAGEPVEFKVERTLTDLGTGPRQITVDAPNTVPPSSYTQGAFRWELFDRGGSVTFRVSGSQPGFNAIDTAQRALAAWTNDPASNVSYVYGGTSSNAFVQDGNNTIVYNSATDVPSGAIAFAKWYGGATHTYKGESFYSITEGDVVVRSGLSASAAVFDEAVTHELGHTLGFRHSDQGTPASSEAVMNSFVTGNFGASLGPWDRDAAGTVYTAAGGGVVTPPGPVATEGRSFAGDFNGDGRRDILLQDSSGNVAIWLMNGFARTSGAVVASPGSTWRVAGPGDFNADGRSDILLQNTGTGQVAIWLMNGFSIASSAVVAAPGTAWSAVTFGDFDGDRYTDVVLQNRDTSAVAVWLMRSFALFSSAVVATPGAGWRAATAGDLDGDGRADLVLQNTSSGAVAAWLMNGVAIALGRNVGTASSGYRVMVSADINGDARADILLQNLSTGDVAGWLMNGTSLAAGASIGNAGAFRLATSGDFNGNGTGDAILQNAAGDVAEWQLNGFAIAASAIVGSPGSAWRVVGY